MYLTERKVGLRETVVLIRKNEVIWNRTIKSEWWVIQIIQILVNQEVIRGDFARILHYYETNNVNDFSTATTWYGAWMLLAIKYIYQV